MTGAAALAALLGFGILTIWVPGRWALGAYQAGALLLAAAWTGRAAWSGRSLHYSPLAWPIAGAVLWGTWQASSGSTVYPWATWDALLGWAVNLALFLAALQALVEPTMRRRFVELLLHFGFVLSAVATVQVFSSDGKIFWLFPSGYTDYVLGPFVSRNQYAAFIEMVLPLALTEALKERSGRLRYWAMAAIMVASVVAGASRAGTVLVILEILLIPPLAVRRGAISGRKAGLALGPFALLAAAAVAVVGWECLWQRFQQPDPYAGRREMLYSSIDMVRERPWTGIGMGTWPTAYPRYARYDDGTYVNQAHNDWSQWAVEGGLPLIAVMLVFAAMTVRPALHSLWGFGLLAVLAHCLVDYPMQQRPPLAGFFFAMAGALAAREVTRNVRCRDTQDAMR